MHIYPYIKHDMSTIINLTQAEDTETSPYLKPLNSADTMDVVDIPRGPSVHM